MNQLNKFRDFMHGNLSKNDRQMLSSVVMNEEKHVDNIKAVLTNADKKLTDTLYNPKGELDSKKKKYPSASLNKFFQDASDKLSTSKTDSVLSKTLMACSQLQAEFTNLLMEHESLIEQTCLNEIEGYLKDDLPSIYRTRKQLTKANEELKTTRAKYESSMTKTNNSQSSQNLESLQYKSDQLRKEVDNCELKLEQCRDLYEIDIFDFLSKELAISEVFYRYVKILEDYHEKMLSKTRHFIPVLEGVLQNTTQKPVFGVALDEHLRSSGRKISIVIEKCIEYLIPYVQEEGLFRISGSKSKVRRMCNAFNAGRLDALQELRNDASVIVSTLKCYLRELPEPLLTFGLYSNWVDAAKESDPTKRLEGIWRVCDTLPEENYLNLGYLMRFLNELTKNSDLNKMTSQNLAIAIGPSLLWPKADTFDLFMSNNLPSLVESLISHCDYFFPEKNFSDLNLNFKNVAIDNSNSLSDNSDLDLNRSQHSLNSNNRKKPAPKPPSPSTTPNQQQSSVAGSENQTLQQLQQQSTSVPAPSKIRSKIGSLKFKPKAHIEEARNIFQSVTQTSNKNQQPQQSIQEPSPINSRMESPPPVYLAPGSHASVNFRKSPAPDFVGNNKNPISTKSRPKSVCERPTVAPPSVPPRPSIVQQASPKSQERNSIATPVVDEYPELNHIDSESEENCPSNSSCESKDFNMNDIRRKPEKKEKALLKTSQQDLTKALGKLDLMDNVDNGKEQRLSSIKKAKDQLYPSLNGLDKEHRNDAYCTKQEQEVDSRTPQRPPRAHSSNGSASSASGTSYSSSNLSLNTMEGQTVHDLTKKLGHYRSDSCPNNEVSKSEAKTDEIPKSLTPAQANQTYL